MCKTILMTIVFKVYAQQTSPNLSGYEKKRECLYLLLVPLSEASRIAYWSWTATQKPTLEYATKYSATTPHGG